MSETAKTLMDLKVGDNVVVSYGSFMANEVIGKVEEATPAKIKVRGELFDRKTGKGRVPTGRFESRRYVRICTPEDITSHNTRVRREKTLLKMSQLDWSKYPTSILDQVLAVFEEADRLLNEKGENDGSKTG